MNLYSKIPQTFRIMGKTISKFIIFSFIISVIIYIFLNDLILSFCVLSLLTLLTFIFAIISYFSVIKTPNIISVVNNQLRVTKAFTKLECIEISSIKRISIKTKSYKTGLSNRLDARVYETILFFQLNDTFECNELIISYRRTMNGITSYDTKDLFEGKEIIKLIKIILDINSNIQIDKELHFFLEECKGKTIIYNKLNNN